MGALGCVCILYNMCVKVHVCVHACLCVHARVCVFVCVCVYVAPRRLCVGFCMHRMAGVGGAVQDFG